MQALPLLPLAHQVVLLPHRQVQVPRLCLLPHHRALPVQFLLPVRVSVPAQALQVHPRLLQLVLPALLLPLPLRPRRLRALQQLLLQPHPLLLLVLQVRVPALRRRRAQVRRRPVPRRVDLPQHLAAVPVRLRPRLQVVVLRHHLASCPPRLLRPLQVPSPAEDHPRHPVLNRLASRAPSHLLDHLPCRALIQALNPVACHRQDHRQRRL